MSFHSKAYAAAKRKGYRSGLEVKIKDQLKGLNRKFEYETIKIEWEDLMYRKYTPDFILDNGIIVETKGLFTAADRRKHLQIKEQHPDIEIRFVFESSKRRLSKISKTTYADWCIKHEFKYADKEIPEGWLKETSRSKIKYPLIIPYPHKRKA
jgi:hypothetical protein